MRICDDRLPTRGSRGDKYAQSLQPPEDLDEQATRLILPEAARTAERDLGDAATGTAAATCRRGQFCQELAWSRRRCRALGWAQPRPTQS